MNMTSDTMNVFDRKLVQRHRDRAAKDFDAFDFLFMEGAERLCDRLFDINRTFEIGLDIGCHGGEVGKTLAGSGKIEKLLQSDFSNALAIRAKSSNGNPTLVLDEEALPFELASFDVIATNLSLHWVNDLPGALSQVRLALKSDGLFLGAVLGGDTLHELRNKLAEAEIEIDGGLSPRVSPFADVRDLGALLQRAGFALPVVDTETITVKYTEPFKLLSDLRGMGESNAVLERRKTPLKREILMRAMANYVEEFSDDEGRIPATFQILTMTAWAPSPTQQKPLRPGSAGSRLSDALGGDEVSLGEKAKPDKT